MNCQSEIAYLGKYKVDGAGDGSKSNTADVSGTSGEFSACDRNRDRPSTTAG